MGFFDKFKSVKKTGVAAILNPGYKDGDFMFPLSPANSLSWASTELTHLLDYLEVPEVASIINMKARAFANMKLQTVSKTTGLPVKVNESRILNNPNYFQSQKEFLMQTKLFQEIFGNEVLYFLKGVGMPVSAMFTLPPLFVDIDEMGRQPYWLERDFPEAVKYHIEWNGQRMALNTDDICHINNAKVKLLADDVYWGESTMKSLQAPISNIRAAYEARNVLIENRGALGILSNNSADGMGATMPLDGDEKTALQNDFKKYGVTKKQWQIIITSLNLKWQQMSIDADKLKLFEEVKADTEQICDAYGVPFELLSNQKGTTFENRKNAEKTFYTGTIIPEAEEWAGAINRKWDTEGKSWEVRATFEHLDIFSDNQRERAQSIAVLINGLSKALADGAITLDQYQKEMQKLKIGI